MKDDTTCSIDKIYPGVFISLSDTLVQYLLLYSRKPVYSFKNGCDCENIVWVNFRKEIKLSTESIRVHDGCKTKLEVRFYLAVVSPSLDNIETYTNLRSSLPLSWTLYIPARYESASQNPTNGLSQSLTKSRLHLQLISNELGTTSVHPKLQTRSLRHSLYSL